MFTLLLSAVIAQQALAANVSLESVSLRDVTIEDTFWSPKLALWQQVTIPDCFDKFEKTGALVNFDCVRDGKAGEHGGPPWYDGLIYEMIRATADFLACEPDAALESRIDGYIERIAAAAEKDPDGYIETFTQLMEPDHRWGLNGGYERISHDLYNAGALIEAGVHYYQATGKTRLLSTAVRMANLMYKTMGPPPKRNIIPSHPLGEEAAVKLYLLFRDHPELKEKVGVPVREQDYLDLAQFWLEARGHHCGKPDWEHLSEKECCDFIRGCLYGDDRPSWGAYAQDHKPVLEQETIEGHAVRATLMCAGLTAAAAVNGREDYARAAQRLWENMTFKKMHISGGVGAFANDEKFGPDYVLPNNAYLETCAAVGAGFFHWNMLLLFGDGRYATELERVLYNGALCGVSLEGKSYFYENPLEATNRQRWEWHGCPCCPPMFLKLMGALPGYIYAVGKDAVYVNLFIGSRARFTLGEKSFAIVQKTTYPWEGNVALTVETDAPVEFDLRVRASALTGPITFNVNGKQAENLKVEDGYGVLKRTWRNGDCVTTEIPLPVRMINAHPAVEADRGRIALMRGPILYCVESADNPNGVKTLWIPPDAQCSAQFRSDLLGGVTVITGRAVNGQSWPAEALYGQLPDKPEYTQFTAIPYFANSNRTPGDMAVWLPIASR